MRNFGELMKKKMENKEFVDDKEKNVISDLLKDMTPSSEIDKKMSGLSKVTVAADDSEGLAEGLDMAKEIAKELPSEDITATGDMGESEVDSIDESVDTEMLEGGEELSIEDQIAKLESDLMALKAKVKPEVETEEETEEYDEY